MLIKMFGTIFVLMDDALCLSNDFSHYVDKSANFGFCIIAASIPVIERNIVG